MTEEPERPTPAVTGRRIKKPFAVQWRFPRYTDKSFTEWKTYKRYETKSRAKQALVQLKKDRAWAQYRLAP